MTLMLLKPDLISGSNVLMRLAFYMITTVLVLGGVFFARKRNIGTEDLSHEVSHFPSATVPNYSRDTVDHPCSW